MIDQIIVLITALVFFFLGYYNGGYREVTQRLHKHVTKGLNKKGTIIDYITPEQSAYNSSYEKKVDEAREKVFKEQFEL